MHILLTRPIEDCSEMIVKFQSLDHKVSHLPLINVQKVQHEEINSGDYGGLIFTSSNAVKNLNVENLNKKLICFCVGSATEKKLEVWDFKIQLLQKEMFQTLKN